MRKILITGKVSMTSHNKTPLNVAFGSAVRSLRKSLAITQEELAGRAGLHRTYVTKVERGDCNLSLECIDKLANALGSSMSALLGVAEIRKAKQLEPSHHTQIAAPKTQGHRVTH